MQDHNYLKLLSHDIPRVLCDSRCSFEIVTDQCDCACATNLPSIQSAPTISPAIHEASFYSAGRFSYVNLATDSYATLGLYPPLTIVLNNSALAMVQHFNQTRPLTVPSLWYKMWGESAVKSVVEQMITFGLLVPENCLSNKPIEKPTTLSAWLHITDRCNLRCPYCYLPHNQVDMPVAIGHAAVEATFRSAIAHNFRQVKFKYAGGEPLLRFPIITELHQQAQALAERHSLALDGIILSNGTLLTRQIIKTIKSLDMRLMISLDGLGNFHDRQRYYPNGHGSFAGAEKAVELALTYNLIPDISITISDRNAEGLPELIDWILAHDLPFSLNFYRENELSATYENLKLSDEKIIAGVLSAFKVIESNLPRRNLLTSLVDRANLAIPHLHTCNVGSSYLVFNHLGQVAKCQMQINQPVTTAYVADPLNLIRDDDAGIQNISVEQKEICRDCVWKYWCTGGCPLATYQATGRYDIKSVYCSIYKILFPEAVRLEGLRLLKYANEMN